MTGLGWGPYQNDHEDANGQFEINWNFNDALTTADQLCFFKFMVKAIAEKHGLRATFMPKPFLNLTGNGCHVHLSVWDGSGKRTSSTIRRASWGFQSSLTISWAVSCTTRRRWWRSPIRRSTPTSASTRR